MLLVTGSPTSIFFFCLTLSSVRRSGSEATLSDYIIFLLTTRLSLFRPLLMRSFGLLSVLRPLIVIVIGFAGGLRVLYTLRSFLIEFSYPIIYLRFESVLLPKWWCLGSLLILAVEFVFYPALVPFYAEAAAKSALYVSSSGFCSSFLIWASVQRVMRINSSGQSVGTLTCRSDLSEKRMFLRVK